MKLSHHEATQHMHTIKHLLAGLGLADVSVEYPAFLSIMRNGVEYHAGYTFSDDENDTAEFQIYDANDGVYGERLSFEFATDGDALNIARAIAYELSLSKLTA